MAFKPIGLEDGAQMYVPGAATAITKGNALKNSSGNYTPSASGDNTDVEFVAVETITPATAGDPVLAVRVKGVKFVADTSNTPTAAQMNTYVDLSAAGTIDTSATTDAVFFAAKLLGPASDKKVIGWFQQGAINS